MAESPSRLSCVDNLRGLAMSPADDDDARRTGGRGLVTYCPDRSLSACLPQTRERTFSSACSAIFTPDGWAQ